MAFWFQKGSDKVLLANLEDRVAALEKRMFSASDILEATERMDRIVKRSFRLKAQIDALEEQKEAPKNGALSRHDLLKMAR